MKPGRNDPCPCGSGKKYKHCCLLASAQAVPESPDDLAWRRLHRLLDEWQQDMLRFTVNVYGRGVMDEAWREFMENNRAAFDPETAHLQLFMGWLYHCWSPEAGRTGVRDPKLHGVVPTAEYLRRKKSLDPLLRTYLESCLAQPLSVLEVLRADPGRGLRLRDLFTGAEHEVIERSASKLMREGDLIFGQVATAGSLTLLEISQTLAISPESKSEVISFRKRHFKGSKTAPRERLRELEAELLALYRDIAKRRLEPRMPQMQNTDGEPLSPRKLVFEIDSAQEAFDALKHLSLSDSDGDLLRDAARDTAGNLVRVNLSWLKRGNAQNPGWDNTVLGSMEIDGARLTAEVNSEAREKALRAIVAGALGARARYRATEIRSLEQMLAEARASGPNPAAAKESAALAELPEVKAKMAEIMGKFYEHWVHENIPALGGRTPLEAVRDRDGRDAVEALVRQIERDGERMKPPLDPGIVRNLRERLGLAKGA
ncbi:MAG: SEC-C domain-containing protein [Betaproteobacteria bacterium]|nr:SEC-C domain-containing protein [Betaproteobacteria bacterium]